VNDATVLIVGDLAWPFVVLVLVILVLATQRRPLGRLIDRIRSFSVPGGSAELAGSVSEGGADNIFTLVEALTRNVSEQIERAEPLEGEHHDSEVIQNREPLAEFARLADDEVNGLVMLRTKLTNLLFELTYPPPPGGFGAVDSTIDVLSERGVLDDETAQALRRTVVIADQAARGATVPPRVVVAVENSGPAILEQLALLRTVAAARFEDHVLDTLQRELPVGWSVDIDRAIASDDLPELAGALADGAKRHARVDALVSAAGQEGVIEVRARLQPGAPGQVKAVQDWIEVLPSALPILLVMLGDRLTARELEQITGDREGPVEILQWDVEAASLMAVLRRLLMGSGVPASVTVPL
jgi:hypothetical protein